MAEVYLLSASPYMYDGEFYHIEVPGPEAPAALPYLARTMLTYKVKRILYHDLAHFLESWIASKRDDPYVYFIYDVEKYIDDDDRIEIGYIRTLKDSTR